VRLHQEETKPATDQIHENQILFETNGYDDTLLAIN
jgi:hypothetical protein